MLKKTLIFIVVVIAVIGAMSERQKNEDAAELVTYDCSYKLAGAKQKVKILKYSDRIEYRGHVHEVLKGSDTLTGGLSILYTNGSDFYYSKDKKTFLPESSSSYTNMTCKILGDK